MFGGHFNDYLHSLQLTAPSRANSRGFEIKKMPALPYSLAKSRAPTRAGKENQNQSCLRFSPSIGALSSTARVPTGLRKRQQQAHSFCLGGLP